MKKEKIKKNIFLVLAVLAAFLFIAVVMCTIMGDDSPVKFIINESPIKIIVPPALVFLGAFTLYKNSEKVIEKSLKKDKYEK